MYLIDMSSTQPQVTEVKARSILTPQKFGSLAGGYDFSLNPYAGCAFSCSYCYVPKFPSAKHASFDWGKWVEVKVNAPELIRKDRALVFGSRIFFSSATDPYQYLELQYRLTRACLRELLKYKPARLTMHTRSHLLLEDLDLLKQFGDVLRVGVSITSDDEDVVREFEPKAPAFARRLELIKTLRDNNIEVFASIAPLLPHQPERLAGFLAPYVRSAWIDQMHWPEVNTKPILLTKYASYFQEENYQASVIQLKSALTARGIQIKG